MAWFNELYPVNTPVIYNGKFATITGYDRAAEQIIIEFCDHKDGKFVAVNPFNLSFDEESVELEKNWKVQI